MGGSNRRSALYTLCLFSFPLKGKREVWRVKTESHIFHVPFRSFPPLVAIAVMFIMSYDKEKQIP